MPPQGHVKAVNKYNAKAYDRLNIFLPKGQKEAVEAHAQSKGESVNGFVNTLIRTDMGLSETEWKNPKPTEQKTDEAKE